MSANVAGDGCLLTFAEVETMGLRKASQSFFENDSFAVQDAAAQPRFDD